MKHTQEKITTRACLILFLAVTFYFYEALLQVSPSVMVPELMRSFHVNAAALGHLAAFYFYAYTAMQMPVGVLVDKYGPRCLLTIASILCVMGCLIFGSTHNLHYAQLSRLLIGIGGAFAAIGCFQLANRWFPANRFAMLVGLIVGLSLVGSANGETTVAILVDHVGWRQTMMIFAGVGTVIAVLIALFVRDHPPHMKPLLDQEAGLWEGLPGILRNPQSWSIALYGSLMFTPTLVFAGLWGVPFLMASYPLTRTYAATLIALIFMGWAVGGPVMGWFSDHLGRRKVPMTLAAGLGAIISVVIIYKQLPLAVLGVLLFVFGFVCSGFLPAFATVREINAPENTATALGFMNTMNSIGAALLQPLVGYILDQCWDGKLAAGIHVYSQHHFHSALAVLPIMLSLALLMIPFIKETYCKRS